MMLESYKPNRIGSKGSKKERKKEWMDRDVEKKIEESIINNKLQMIVFGVKMMQLKYSYSWKIFAT